MIESKKVGIVGRFKPLHLTSAKILETLCKKAEEVIIGIGSSNRYDVRNPFTADESEKMIRLALKAYSNYRIIHIPDSGHLPEFKDGRKWVEDVYNGFGNLDFFVTGNPYVGKLLRERYNIIHPLEVMPASELRQVKGSEVRLKMALGENWKDFVPDKVAEYIEQELLQRFKKEFGKETLSASYFKFGQETIEGERARI